MSGAIIISGPPGCGKSRHAEQLRALFGCRVVVDEWDGKEPLPDGALALTNSPPPYTVVGARSSV